jgi:hypothetical protein
VTLLVSLYTSRGIVFAAYSQVISEAQPGHTTRLDPQEKVLPVKRIGVARVGGVVGFFGLAEMRGEPIETWLRERIDRFGGSRTVEEFAVYLRDELRAAVRKREREVVSGFHIGGFEMRDEVVIPVFHFLRNTTRFDPATGMHSNLVDYWTEEHFPTYYAPDVPSAELRWGLRDHETRTAFPFWLRNGDLAIAGRTWHGLQEAAIGMAALPRFGTVTDLEASPSSRGRSLQQPRGSMRCSIGEERH